MSLCRKEICGRLDALLLVPTRRWGLPLAPFVCRDRACLCLLLPIPINLWHYQLRTPHTHAQPYPRHCAQRDQPGPEAAPEGPAEIGQQREIDRIGAPGEEDVNA